MNRYLLIFSVVGLMVAGLIISSVLIGPRTSVYQNSKQTAPSNPTDEILPTVRTVRFLAVGDIMLSRGVAYASTLAHDPKLPFSSLHETLLGNDFNFGNLESPFSGNDHFSNAQTLLFNAPGYMLPGLTDNKFTVLNLANNHAMDQGSSGLIYTKELLGKNNINTVGTGATLEEAWTPKLVTYNGITIGFVGASYSSENDNGKSKNNFVARIEDTDRLQEAIVAAKAKADYVIVTMHAGTEYTRTANAAQIAFAHAAVDDGADMVIGAHPHWIQNIEQYKDKYIFYSLGNFIFDQDWSQTTKEGLTLDITLTKSSGRQAATIQTLTLMPVVIEKKAVPRAATEIESKAILSSIGITSPALVAH